MKIARYLSQGLPLVGLVVEDQIVPLPEELAKNDTPSLIAQWPALRPRLTALAQDRAKAVPIASVELLAPIGRPGKIFAIGLNYADHIAESGLQRPEQQLWFAKLINTVHPPYAPVQIPKASDKVDYEVEMVVVVGKGGRHIAREQAPDHVFGYCIGNDVSVRDWQAATSQWILGKSFDTHGPFGPWITTADEIGDPHRLAIRSLVNGELRQSSNTRNLVFDVWDQIAHLSKAITLEAGDILYSGTPGGVGWAMTPRRVLAAGDVVRCEIEELGWIENGFVAE